MPSATETVTRTPASRWRRLVARRWFAPAAAGVIAIAAGAALPLAPVEQSEVYVTWPAAGEQVESTTLLLTNQTPHSLEVTFSGEAALSVADGGTVFSTIRADAADAGVNGLVASVSGDVLTVETGGSEWSSSVATSDQWRIVSTIHGLQVLRDGTTLHDDSAILPPQVDALLTDAVGLDAEAMSARLQLVDDTDNRPTPLKVGLIAVCVIALVLMLMTLRRDDDARPTASRRARAPAAVAARPALLRRVARSLSTADILVVGLLTLWIFIGPMTDDDGYYSVMAYNADVAGYVGNYFQMFNQTFTPFTWIWQFFDLWQQAGGRSPVWLRVPSLVFALVGWFVTRWLLQRMLGGMRWLLAEGVRLLLAVVTFVWWASYAIGARPEAFVAMATVVVVALLVRAYDARRLVPAALAVAMAAWSFATHPIGIVSAAPLLVSVPMLWRIARENSSIRVAAARTIAVASSSAVALLAAFNDGSLYDMITGQRRFSLVEQPLTWVNEFRRYGLLFADIPMGSYARRAVVLVGVVLLIWFVVFVLWSRRVGPFADPVPLSLVGWSFAVSFLLMWITTSKWTHHFGSLASIGPLFIVAVSVVVPRLVVRQLGRGSRIAPWLMPAAVVSLVPPMIVALQGPDQWAYDWGSQWARPSRPEVFGVSLANYAAWTLLTVLIIGGMWLGARRLAGSWRSPATLHGVGVIVAVFFAMTGGYLAASFVWTSSPLYDGFSVGKAYLADPTGSQCMTDRNVRLWDAATGSPLSSADASARADGFEDVADAAMALPRSATGLGAWTTAGTEGVGSLTTGWYRLPELTDDQRVAVLSAGDFATGTVGSLTAEFRDSSGGTTDVPVADTAVRPGWSTLTIGVPATLSQTDEVQVRLRVEDASALPGADVSVSEPVVATGATLHDIGDPDDPTAVGWTQTFWFPCDRPMQIADGVIEPPRFATTFGPDGIDAIWVLGRGGSLAGVQRLATVNTPAAGLGDAADAYWGRVHLFEYPTPAHAYELAQSWRVTPGWRSGFDPASQLVVR